MLNENEDFVEIVAAMLTNAQYSNEPKKWVDQLKNEDGTLSEEVGEFYLSSWEGLLYSWAWDYSWDDRVYFITPQGLEAYNKFETKVNIVTTYYKEKWGIDMYSLQRRIELAVDALIK